MCDQKLHLVSQYASVAQNEIFPQTGYIRCVQQWHVGLLGRAMTFAVVAGLARGNHVHPGIHTFLRKRNDVLTRQVLVGETVSTIGAHAAVAVKQFAVGQTGAEIKRIDVWYAAGANNAVDPDNGLQTRHRIMSAVEDGNFPPRLPAHLV